MKTKINDVINPMICVIIGLFFLIKRVWPVIINLRADPYEVIWMELQRWIGDNLWTLVTAQNYVAEFLGTFKEYPPLKGSSLSVDLVLKQMLEQSTTGN